MRRGNPSLKLAALALPLVLLAAALGGCVQNLPTPARDWLAQQDGIASATVLADNTGAWSSSGLVRGELQPGIDDASILKLVGKIQDFSSQSGGVAFWLGLGGLDFGVSAGDNSGTVSLWRKVLDVPGVANGIVFDDDLRVRALRPDAVATLGDLLALDSGVRLEAFADKAALDADRDADIQYDQINPAALEYKRPPGCVPDAAVLDFAQTLVDRD
ncbi:MAG: hypothetical protein JWP32_1522, partial [Schumannella sp.]|nr:hypothetical protein [Schumannella sp.]